MKRRRKVDHLMKLERIEIGVTQKVIAQDLGMTRSGYANIENGHRQPPLGFMHRYIDVIRRRTPRTDKGWAKREKESRARWR